jgi:hypothetical protein
VLNTVDGCIPSDLGVGTSEEIEEERRLLYVAITRAKDQLHLLIPQRFYARGQARLRAKDPFHPCFDHASLRKLHVADCNAGNPVIRCRSRQNGCRREVAAHVELTATRACPFRVISGQTSARQNPPLSAYGQIVTVHSALA